MIPGDKCKWSCCRTPTDVCAKGRGCACHTQAAQVTLRTEHAARAARLRAQPKPGYVLNPFKV